MKKEMVFIFIFFLLTALAACAPAQPYSTPDPLQSASHKATEAANQGGYAQSTIIAATREAEETRAVQASYSAEETRAVEEVWAAGTRTTESALDNLALTHQEKLNALEVEKVREQNALDLLVQENVTTNEQANHDAAIALMDLNLRKIELENQELENEINTRKVFPYIYLVIAILLLGVAVFFINRWDQGRRGVQQHVVDEGEEGEYIIHTVQTGDGPRVVDTSSAIIPGQRALRAGGDQLKLGAGGGQLRLSGGLGWPNAPFRQSGNRDELQAAGVRRQSAAGANKKIFVPSGIPMGSLAIGASKNGSLVYKLSELSNMKVAGLPGSGKSTFLHSLAYQAVQQKWETFFIDVERVTFSPDVWGNVAQTDKDVTGLLDFLINTLFERRIRLYATANQQLRIAFNDGSIREPFVVDNLSAYTQAARIFPELPALSPLMLVWDEAGSHWGNKDVRSKLLEVIRRSRKYGGFVVIANQNWYASGAQKVDGAIVKLLPWPVCFKVDQQTSTVLLGPGNLQGSLIRKDMQGRAIIRRDDGKPGQMQSFLVPPRKIFQVTPSVTQNTPDHIWQRVVGSTDTVDDVDAISGEYIPNDSPGSVTMPMPLNGAVDVSTESTAVLRSRADAAWLVDQSPDPFRSRRQIAIRLTASEENGGKGIDNKAGYARCDDALKIIADGEDGGGGEWRTKAKMLLASRSTMATV